MNNHATSARHISYLAVASLTVTTFILSACSSGGSSTPTYTVGGSVIGAMGTGLVMQLNGASNLAISADGAFTFSTALTSGSSYAVTALSYPTGQTCRVTNGSGNLTANVSNVSVECRTNADPNGYYTNTGNASVGDGATPSGGLLAISDFQAIIQDNRFMAMSVAEKLVYDGPLEMFGNEFTATVSVYHEGVMIYSGVSVSGTVEAGVSVDGDFAGTQQGAGSFGLLYATTNTGDADVARLLPTMANPLWSSPLGSSTTSTLFSIDSVGDISGDVGPSDGNFQNCTIYSISSAGVALTPIASSRLYRVTVQLGDCDNASIRTIASGGTAGNYTGFATSRTDSPAPDDTLVFIVTSANGQYTASGDFK